MRHAHITFYKNDENCPSEWLHQCIFPTSSVWLHHFTTIWSYLIFTNLTGNTNELSFTLHFPDYKMRLSSLYMFIGHLYFHFYDTTYLFHFKNVLFVFLLLIFNRPSNILDTTLYLLGTLQMISSNVQNLQMLVQLNVSNFFHYGISVL